MNYCKLLSEVYVLQIYGNAITIIEIYWRGKIIDFIVKKISKKNSRLVNMYCNYNGKSLSFQNEHV